jgi:hypothetical protein
LFQLEKRDELNRAPRLFAQLMTRRKHVQGHALWLLLQILPLYVQAHFRLSDFKILPFYEGGLQVGRWLIKQLDIPRVAPEHVFRAIVVNSRSGIIFILFLHILKYVFSF